MKELLQRLSINELRELAQKYIDEYTPKMNSQTIVYRLAQKPLDIEDIQWIKELAQTDEEKMQDEAYKEAQEKGVVKPEPTITYEDKNEKVVLSSAQMEAKAKYEGEQRVAYLAAKARKEAEKTVIAYVSPLSREDLSIGKTAEAFITGNAYFTISVVVPFNVYVEIPKCIAEVIRETEMPIITELNTEQASRFPNSPSSVFRLGKKYNIQVMNMEQFNNSRGNITL